MRIRQVKPSFWTDDKLAALNPAVRLFYVGLWMIADDSGWLRWNVPEIGNELYGYESRKKRERDVVAFAQLLEDAGRIRRLDCGHAIVPTLVSHQRFSGQTKQVHTVEREHMTVCGDSPALPRPSPQSPAPPRPVSNGIGKGTVSVAGVRDGLANLDGAALDALESRTGHVASVAGDKQLNEYDRLIADHGLDPVLAAFDAVRDGKRMTARQLVWGAVKVLEPFADPKKAVAAATSQHSLESTQRYLRELRGEAS